MHDYSGLRTMTADDTRFSAIHPPGKRSILYLLSVESNMGGETSFQMMWNLIIFFTSCHVVKKRKKKKKKKVLAHDLQQFYSIFFQMSHHHGSHGSRSVNCGTFPGKTKKKKVGCARGSRYAPTDYRRFLTILLGTFFLTKTRESHIS